LGESYQINDEIAKIGRKRSKISKIGQDLPTIGHSIAGRVASPASEVSTSLPRHCLDVMGSRLKRYEGLKR